MATCLRYFLRLVCFLCCPTLVFAGQFLRSTQDDVPGKPVFVAAGDFNGDGIADLVVCSQQPYVFSVLQGNGDGTFQVPKIRGASLARGLAVADLNHDGKLDVVMGDGAVGVALGNGDGTFQKVTYYSATVLSYGVTIGDVDKDGNPDVLINDQTQGGVDILLGNGDGTLQPPIFANLMGSFPRDVVVTDFSGDGIPDIATDNTGNNAVGVALGNGDGTFQAATLCTVGYLLGLVDGDFNGDTNVDLVTAVAGNVVFLPGNGDGTFGAAMFSKLKTLNPQIAGVGDFNRDGRLDVAIAQAAPDLELELGTGSGSFRNNGPYYTGADALNGTVADFNGDGWPDVAVPGFNARDVSVLINKGYR